MEWENRRKALANGITLPPDVVESLRGLSQDIGPQGGLAVTTNIHLYRKKREHHANPTSIRSIAGGSLRRASWRAACASAAPTRQPGGNEGKGRVGEAASFGVRCGAAAVLVRLDGKPSGELLKTWTKNGRNEEARRRPHAIHSHVDRSEDRLGSSLRGGRLLRLSRRSNGRCTSRTPASRTRRSSRTSRRSTRGSTRRRRQVRSALQRRNDGHGQGLRAAHGRFAEGQDNYRSTPGRGTQRRHLAVFQSAMRRRRPNHRRRLAGPLGDQVRP